MIGYSKHLQRVDAPSLATFTRTDSEVGDLGSPGSLELIFGGQLDISVHFECDDPLEAFDESGV